MSIQRYGLKGVIKTIIKKKYISILERNLRLEQKKGGLHIIFSGINWYKCIFYINVFLFRKQPLASNKMSGSLESHHYFIYLAHSI